MTGLERHLLKKVRDEIVDIDYAQDKEYCASIAHVVGEVLHAPEGATLTWDEMVMYLKVGFAAGRKS